MIVSFRSKALERFWVKGERKHIAADQITRLTERLAYLNDAKKPDDMNVAGWRFHALTGTDAGRYSVRVTANWRLTFGWSATGADAIDVDFQDYH